MARRRRRVVVGGAALVALVAVAGGLAFVWSSFLRDTAEPSSVAGAVTRFREQAQAADLAIAPGVYVYATAGRESISALGGTTHDYPPESTITVAAGGCGVTLRWDVLETRRNEYELCDGARQLAGWLESHQFFGQDDSSTWACEAAWLPADTSTGAETPYRCADGGTVQEGTTLVVGTEMLAVAGEDVATVHLRVEAAESGEADGTLAEDRWLESDTGLPVRIAYEARTTNRSPIGDVVFEERYTLELTSFQPRR